MRRRFQNIRAGFYKWTQRVLQHHWASFVLDFAARFNKLGVFDRAAATSYYMLFAIFPFLIFTFVLGGQIVTALAPELSSSGHLQAVVPESLEHLFSYVWPLVGNFNYGRFVLISIISLVIACSKGFAQIVRSLNLAYERERMKSNFFLYRLFGILISLALGLVLILFFFILSFGQVVLQWVQKNLKLPFLKNSHWVSFMVPLLSLLLLTLLFGLALYYMSGRKGSVRSAFACGAGMSLGWSLSTAFLSGSLVRNQRYALLYGSFAGIMMLLLWIFVSMIILYSGAVLHATWLHWQGSLSEKEKSKNPDLIKKLKTIEAQVDSEFSEKGR